MDDATIIKTVSRTLYLRRTDTQASYKLQGETVVGRGADCQIVLDSPHISRHHAKIFVSANGVFIEDLLSSNGTSVNGKNISSRARIKAGDQISFDTIAFIVALPQTQAIQDKHSQTQIAQYGTKKATAKALESRTAGAYALASKTNNTAPADPLTPPHNSDTQFIPQDQLQHIAKRNIRHQGDVKLGSGARLVMVSAPTRGKVFALHTPTKHQTEWTIGRAPCSDIHLLDKAISSQHALLKADDNRFTLLSSEPKNGILINGHWANKALLRHKDTLQIGRIELIFYDGSQEYTEQPAQDSQWVSSVRTHSSLIFIGLLTLVIASLIIFSVI